MQILYFCQVPPKYHLLFCLFFHDFSLLYSRNCVIYINRFRFVFLIPDFLSAAALCPFLFALDKKTRKTPNCLHFASRSYLLILYPKRQKHLRALHLLNFLPNRFDRRFQLVIRPGFLVFLRIELHRLIRCYTDLVDFMPVSGKVFRNRQFYFRTIL